MIIQKDKTIINSGDKEIAESVDYFFVDEGSELAQKINGLYPNFEMVIENEELIDVIEIPKPEPTPPEPTEIEILQQKVAEQDKVIEELMFVIIPEIMGGI